MIENGADFGELFFEDRTSNSMEMTNGSMEMVSSGRIRGVGLRAFLGTNEVYAYTNDLSRDSILATATSVGKALKGSRNQVGDFKLLASEYEQIHRIHLNPSHVTKSVKAQAMRLAHEGASTFSELVTQIKVLYKDYDQIIIVANSKGVYVTDRRLHTNLSVQAVASQGSEKETGSEGQGSAKGIEFFDEIDPRSVGMEAARVASKMILAQHAPAGKMPVVISNGFGGVIFHEACGHSLEATGVAKGNSVFAGKLGQKIAADCVSAVDDGTVINECGSSHFDDEGFPTRKNLLIDRGILKGYLVDILGGRKMNMEPNGCSRRQDYQWAPTSRMSNTFILPGKDIPEDIIADTNYGLYARKFGGGQVMPATGEFNFAVKEGYLIEKGRITKPVRGATLIGKGHEIMLKIDRVGNDLQMGNGHCGQMSGYIPVGLGQPTIRVSEILVGGRNQ
jgi:TldD protein